jgi:hypothetical protein
MMLLLLVRLLFPTNTTDSFALEFALSSLSATSDEQYESIPDDEIALLARNFRTLHKFRNERRRSPRGCFECGDTTHFIADCPKRKMLDSSKKYDYTKRNDYRRAMTRSTAPGTRRIRSSRR